MRGSSDGSAWRMSSRSAASRRHSGTAFLDRQVERLFVELAHLHGLPRSVLPLVQEAMRLFRAAGSIRLARIRWCRHLGRGEERVVGQPADRRYILSFALGVMSASAVPDLELLAATRTRVCVPAEIAMRVAALLRLVTAMIHPRGGGARLAAVVDDGSSLLLAMRSGPGSARALRLLPVRCDLWNAVMSRPITAFSEVPRGQHLTTSLAGVPVRQAAARILLRHLETFATRRYGADYLEDPEFVHEMRSALRKALTASRLFRRVPGVDRRRLKTMLKPVLRTLGQARDVDVFQEFLQDWVLRYGNAETAVKRLRQHTESHRQALSGVVWRAVQNPERQAELDVVMSHLRLAAETRTPKPTTGTDAEDNLTLATIAPAMRRACFQDVLAFQSKLGRLSSVQLHRLRRACRRLSYAGEFFHDVVPPPSLRLLKAAERVQRRLGRVRDLELHERRIRDLAGESAPPLSLAEHAGFAALRGAIRREQRQVRERAAKAWLRLRKRLRAEITVGDGLASGGDSRSSSAADHREAV